MAASNRTSPISAADAQPLPSRRRRTWAVVVAGTVAIAAIAVLASVAFRAPWVFGVALDAGDAAAYQSLIDTRLAETSRANEAAIQRYRDGLETVFTTHAPLLRSKADQWPDGVYALQT